MTEKLTVKDVLVAARASVAQGWTKEVGARNADGAQIFAEHPDAVCWCALGGIWRAVRSNPDAAPTRMELAAERALARAIGLPPAAGVAEAIADWNDAPERTQADVLAAYDAAIAKASW